MDSRISGRVHLAQNRAAIPTFRASPEPPDDAQLLDALNDGLAGLHPKEILERRAFKRRCDWRGERFFERLQVRCGAGGPVDLCLKYSNPFPEREQIGRGPEREAAAYRFLNEHPEAGAPHFWGRLELPDGQSLLVLEFVSGRRLKRVRAPEIWLDVARWLGALHGRLSTVLTDLGQGPPGLERSDTALLEEWARRALRPVFDRYDVSRTRAEPLLRRLEPVAEALGSAPPTLTHGELYCTNVMVRDGPDPGAFCPFDWETASVGCGTLDVAYLGRTEMEVTRESLLSAYAAGWRTSEAPSQTMSDLRHQHRAALVYERLYFLWSAAEHRHVSQEKITKYLGLLEDLMDDFRKSSAA